MGTSKDYSAILRRHDNMVADPLSAILNDKNIDRAIDRVKKNKGKPGIDGMDVSELKDYFKEHRAEIKQAIRNKTYIPAPVRRVYIPKDKDSKRQLGIPTVVDRVLQQATGNVLAEIFEETFSDYSYGYREELSAHDAVEQACDYLNEGHEWVVDLDISKFFDTVNHDKLISMVHTEVKDAAVLHLIRAFLKAGVMEDGKFYPTELGVPQGGPLSSVLSLIYLTPLDNEMEKRGYRFCRYADDVVIFTKSKMAAERVLKSISAWIEKHLYLKVNLTKSKVVRPTRSRFLGFTFMKHPDTKKWVPLPHKASKQKLIRNMRKATSRRFANSMELGPFILKINQIVGGWINYYAICPCLKSFMEEFSENLRHRVRVWIVKHWKKRPTIFENLKKFYYYIRGKNRKCKWEDKIKLNPQVNVEYIYAQCFTRCGWYHLGDNLIVNNILCPKILHSQLFKEGLSKPIALIDPLDSYFNRRANLPIWFQFVD